MVYSRWNSAASLQRLISIRLLNSERATRGGRRAARFLQTVIIIQRGKWLSLFNRPCPGPAFSGIRSKRYAWQVLLLNVFLSSPRRTRIAFSERIILQAAITRCGSIELHTRALRCAALRCAFSRAAMRCDAMPLSTVSSATLQRVLQMRLRS